MAIKSRITPGIGQMVRDLFAGARRFPRDSGEAQRQVAGYPHQADKAERIKYLARKVYAEGAFEKIQLARKWMRNILVFQGYHELEWSEINAAWDALVRDATDYAFPNNYYRSHILYGAGLYVKNAPQFVFAPTGDFESEAVAEAAATAFEIIKENIAYDTLRVWEAINLRLMGNSFRYSYYSLDPRYGHVTAPVYEEAEVAVDSGMFQCPTCGAQGEGNPAVCPVCGTPLPPEAMTPPTMVKVPRQVGTVRYPRGQEVTEVVSPLEVGLRSSAPSLEHAPYLYRARVVDRIALASDFPDVDLSLGEEMGGAAYATEGDISLIYQQTLADLPGDPTQFAAWYERATQYARTMLLQVWLRPSQYHFDKELRERFPDGLYAAIAADKLLESRNESMDDHWVHFIYNPVPGRVWGDGDDDLIPKQLQLDENERLIMRNIAYNSVPQLAVDSQRVDADKFVNDPGEVIRVKMTGRPVAEAFHQMPGMQLPQEVWMWRQSQLQDMEYHSGVFGSAIGQHQPGVNTFGGQIHMAERAEQNLSPLLLMYKEANEKWARQVLKLAAENWLDDRIRSVMGINGNWQFQKLRGAMLDLDKVKIIAKLLPVDYGQQQAMANAVASGLLNPQDPRVQRKALELFQLPTELNAYTVDAKVQWKEIERMKRGEPVEPVLLRDADEVHIEICRTWLNSDDAEQSPPEVVAMVLQHLQAHVINRAKVAQIQAAVQLAPQELAMMMGAPPQAVQPQPAQQEQAPQAGRRGGQVPPNPAVRQARARKGRAAKPNTPQPPEGNQYGLRPTA